MFAALAPRPARPRAPMRARAAASLAPLRLPRRRPAKDARPASAFDDGDGRELSGARPCLASPQVVNSAARARPVREGVGDRASPRRPAPAARCCASLMRIAFFDASASAMAVSAIRLAPARSRRSACCRRPQGRRRPLLTRDADMDARGRWDADQSYPVLIYTRERRTFISAAPVKWFSSLRKAPRVEHAA